ncbi:MAG: hypothetical protein H0T56_13835, partial [Pseudaminobacter sp.]|nr:hypothetical protein [Pseudaminobacter sp.]
MKNSIAPAWIVPAPARTAVEKSAHVKSYGDKSFGEAVRIAHAGKSGQDRAANVPAMPIEPAWTNIELKFTTIAERAAGPKEAPSREEEFLPLEDEAPAEPDTDAPLEAAPAFVAVAAVQLRLPLAAAFSHQDLGRAGLGHVAGDEIPAGDVSTTEKPVRVLVPIAMPDTG